MIFVLLSGSNFMGGALSYFKKSPSYSRIYLLNAPYQRSNVSPKGPKRKKMFFEMMFNKFVIIKFSIPATRVIYFVAQSSLFLNVHQKYKKIFRII